MNYGLERRKVPGDYYVNYEIDAVGYVWNGKHKEKVYYEYSTGMPFVRLIKSDATTVSKRIVDLWVSTFGLNYGNIARLMNNAIGLAMQNVSERRKWSARSIWEIYGQGGTTLEELSEMFGVSSKSHVKTIIDKEQERVDECAREEAAASDNASD